MNPDKYYYLNQTGVYDVPDMDDTEEFRLTMVKKYFQTFSLYVGENLQFRPRLH